MQKSRSSWILGLFLLSTAPAWAEQDFYGIWIRNEEWARQLMLGEKTSADENDLKAGPVLDHAVRGEAFLKPLVEERLDFSVTVFNDSDKPIAAEYEYRDFFLYTRDGKKYPLLDTDEDFPSSIEPRSKATFTPSLGNLRLKNSEVKMIQCSFDLGTTRIFLFPWSMKDKVSKLVSPSPAPAPAPPARPAKPVKEEVAPGPKKKTPKRNFWDWLALNKRSKELKEKEPVKPTAVEKAPPSAPLPSEPAASRDKLDTAIKNFVYKPSDAKSVPVYPSSPLVPSRNEARIIDFNREYNFVTLNLGEADGLQKNMTLSILRDGKVVAKAKVKQVRQAVAAAAVLPDTVRSEVRAGDRVAFA